MVVDEDDDDYETGEEGEDGEEEGEGIGIIHNIVYMYILRIYIYILFFIQ